MFYIHFHVSSKSAVCLYSQHISIPTPHQCSSMTGMAVLDLVGLKEDSACMPWNRKTSAFCGIRKYSSQNFYYVNWEHTTNNQLRPAIQHHQDLKYFAMSKSHEKNLERHTDGKRKEGREKGEKQKSSNISLWYFLIILKMCSIDPLRVPKILLGSMQSKILKEQERKGGGGGGEEEKKKKKKKKEREGKVGGVGRGEGKSFLALLSLTLSDAKEMVGMLLVPQYKVKAMAPTCASHHCFLPYQTHQRKEKASFT